MTEKDQPLRGDAAYQAMKREISARNDAAQKRGQEERAARDLAVRRRRDAAERVEMSQLPQQPDPL